MFDDLETKNAKVVMDTIELYTKRLAQIEDYMITNGDECSKIHALSQS